MLSYFIILFHTQLAEVTRARVLSSTEVFFFGGERGKKKSFVCRVTCKLCFYCSLKKKNNKVGSRMPLFFAVFHASLWLNFDLFDRSKVTVNKAPVGISI